MRREGHRIYFLTKRIGPLFLYFIFQMKTRIVSILVCCSNILFSQQIFQGKIQNEENRPVANVLIQDKNHQTLTQSNAQGIFEVQVSQNTPVYLQADGYETLFDTLRPTSSGQLFVLFFSREELEGIQIKATRANAKTPTTFTNLKKEDVQANNFGQDLPYLLDGTLSTVVSSDAGAGIGYSNIRIRGVDPTRTNVTINGIPINDAESQGMFWVNMPDFASSAENIQIQRGVGTSANGGAAFGASINVKSDNIRLRPYGEIDNSYGSFSTWKNTVKAGTGVINDHFAFDMRLSNITSNGYVDRASSDLKSFYTSGAWFNRKSMLKFNIFGGREITYQAWNGIPESRLKNDVQGMLDYASRNGLTNEETNSLLEDGRTYNYFTFHNQVDRYNQTHYQLHFNHRFNEFWNFNVSGHYTRGLGYYEEYKNDQKMASYLLSPIVIDSATTISKTDLIRRKWLDNHFYGMVYSLNYSKQNLELTYGGGINHYMGAHYGTVIWARHASDSELDHVYYHDDASKIDFNNYLKATYELNNNVIFGDVQIRTVNYVFEGISDLGSASTATQKANYVFFNPKVGWMYNWDFNSLYASLAISNREPIRKDFTENTSGNRPQAERLYNLEIGNRFQKGKWAFNASYYLMYYDNQLILTGEINDVGGTKRTNAKQSYRTGIELEGAYQATKWMQILAGGTYSWNKILHFTEYLDDYDNGGQQAIVHKNTDLALSPNLIASFSLNFEPLKNFNLRLGGKYVSRQYLDNTSDKTRSIDGYYTMNFNASYFLKLPKIEGIEFGLQVNNLLNANYANNGYTYGYIYGQESIRENFYFPQAGINWMGRIAVRI